MPVRCRSVLASGCLVTTVTVLLRAHNEGVVVCHFCTGAGQRQPDALPALGTMHIVLVAPRCCMFLIAFITGHVAN